MTAGVVTRVLADRRTAVVVVGLLLLAATAVWTVGVYPLVSRVELVEQRRDQAAAGLTAAEAALRAATTSSTTQSTVAQTLDEFYGQVLPQSLVDARAITYPRLARLATEHDLVMERRSVVPDVEEDGRLASLVTTMLLAGRWADIRSFMHALEAGPEFIVIEGIVLNQSEELDAPLTLTLSVATYYRRESAT